MVEAHWRKASASRFGAAGEEPDDPSPLPDG